ncbi:AMP-binding protein [Microlunatus sp. GCM10028923]|uniref:AMP-binding protein n=1 Tax=Microlunatus sp. GCM10028923 TaxID=3273400 RepID=UPI0036105120
MLTVEPTPEALTPVLAAALAGGEPVAPLPLDPAERDATLAMLQPEQPIEQPGIAAVLGTSGSTGRPKGVLLSAAAMIASAEATHDRLGGPGAWTLALPAHYVAGLMVLVRGVLAGRPVSVTSGDLADLTAPSGGGRHYLSLVPTQLARALNDPVITAALGGFDMIMIGGAPAAADLLAAAREAGLSVITTYGMSETCGGCVYDREPLPGVTIGLRPEDDRIEITGPMVFSGYRLRPDLTEPSLRTNGETRTLVTADRGRWDHDRLQVLGRIDDVVITGGHNVDLAELERLARQAPAAAGAELAIIGVPDDVWGTMIIAVADRPVDLDRLRADLAIDLPAHGLPRRLLDLPALPRTSSGKIDRQRLVRLATG